MSGRDKLAQALTRVVGRDGITGVSVRTVAAEAGVSGGTVQHHFPTRAAMLHYAMEWTSVQVARRLESVARWGDVHAWTREVLLELLPLDAARRREQSVWLAFVAQARTDPALSDLDRRTNTRLHELYMRIIIARRGLPPTADGDAVPAADPDTHRDATLLQAFVDGLALQLDRLDLDRAGRVGPELLDRYLLLAVDPPVR